MSASHISLGLMLQAGVQHLVFSGLMDPRPFKPNLPVDSSSGRQLPHYETKADIKVTKYCISAHHAWHQHGMA